jgi:hypothetical protein
MARTIAKILGFAFVLIGLIGFVQPGLLGTHLSMTHNIIHLVSGAAALYFGYSASVAGARTFDIAFGAVYALLGVAGFVLGDPGITSAHGAVHSDNNILRVLPGALELGTMDHILHIVVGAIFLVGGLATQVGEAVDTVSRSVKRGSRSATGTR